MRISSAIITAAGLGTRLLPYTKEIPKEMLPLIVRSNSSNLVIPVLHYIFESLFKIGIRKFYLVVGRGKRVIEDYFTPEWSYVDFLYKSGKADLAEILKQFYTMLEKCNIVMINQPSPRGFGDAVLRTRPVMTDSVFIVHAGDDLLFPDHVTNIKRLMDHYEHYKPRIAFLVERSRTPEKYGVVIGEDKGDYIEVHDIIEKPRKPPTDLAVIAIYVFDKQIYNALEETRPTRGEHQLTDGIKYLLEKSEKVHAVKSVGTRIDVGTPDSYLEGLRYITTNR